jgi:hypothetical protein
MFPEFRKRGNEQPLTIMGSDRGGDLHKAGQRGENDADAMGSNRDDRCASARVYLGQ